jgi:hypothetical protein
MPLEGPGGRPETSSREASGKVWIILIIILLSTLYRDFSIVLHGYNTVYPVVLEL